VPLLLNATTRHLGLDVSPSSNPLQHPHLLSASRVYGIIDAVKMAIRFRTSIFLAFGLLVLYFIFWRDDAPFQDGSHTIDVLKGATGTQEYEQDLVDPEPPYDTAPLPTRSVSSNLWQQPSIVSSAVLESTSTSSLAADRSSTSSAVSGTSTGVTDVGSGAAPGESTGAAHIESSTGPEVPEATGASSDDGLTLQAQFEKEYDALGL
jgi:hypothetical protein